MSDSMLNPGELLALEAIIDRTSLARTLEALAHICAQKSRHIEENWQNQPLARRWERAGNMIDKTSAKPAILAIP